MQYDVKLMKQSPGRFQLKIHHVLKVNTAMLPLKSGA